MNGIDISSVLAGSRAMATAFVPFLLTSASVVAGLMIIWSAIRSVYAKGSHQRSMGGEVSWGGIAGKLLVGGMVLRLGASMQDVSNLLFGSDIQDVSGVLAYAPIAATGGVWHQVIEVCLLWVVMLGWAGAFRGFLLWNQGVSGGGQGGQGGDLFWRGTWHILGGAAAVNLSGAISAFVGK